MTCIFMLIHKQIPMSSIIVNDIYKALYLHINGP